MAESKETISLLAWARELGKEYPFYDFHVHPFDVLTGDTTYQVDKTVDGLFIKGAAKYRPPSIVSKLEALKERPAQRLNANSLQAFILASRMAYTCTGKKVLDDQLDLVGLAGVLLLPVARETGGAERLLAASAKMFSDEKRLFLSCPIPIGMPSDKLLSFYQSASNQCGICAIKVHPNLAGIDIFTTSGRELIEATLVAAGRLGLCVVIHGGWTPGLEPVELREYGTIARLKEVDWGLSAAPVILAHCGCYGLAESDANTALSVLNVLLDKYPNLMADTSNLELPVLRLALEKVDPDRLIFGSDALYVPIWKAWLQFLQTLSRVSNRPENDLIRIASLNAQYCLGSTRSMLSKAG
ncbi:MAG TPA: amidohydrolase family protein [Anaerolineales bacterium]|nr:amidohydrolase family protein [Anaerolineales bacterium]